jgi:hypothetical protein
LRPKKSSKARADVVEDSERVIALPLGLVDVEICAIAISSPPGLVRRREPTALR